MQRKDMANIVSVKRAVISVSNKANLDIFAKGLRGYNAEMDILSSGGTAKELRKAGYAVRDVSEYTRFPESPDGLLKTIHPLVAGGILLDQTVLDHFEYMMKNNISPINLVVVNFYPLKEMIARGATIEEIRKHGTDIGGPNMVRAAAKSFPTVAVVVDPEDYTEVVSELDNHGGTTFDMRFDLQKKAWIAVEEYDHALKEYWTSLSKEEARKFYLS
jgi:phosphoribosylaminoimidazolecarboxamide formyltransferase / IMP cyclohydrolase